MKENQKLKEEKISTKPFPRSQKTFVKGKLHEIEVAMREIETDDTFES
jgi:phosphomethylpyrimidine synthase